MWIVFLIGLILFEIVADILGKEWSLGKSGWFAAGALFFFLVCNTFWLLALRSGSGLARGAVIFAVATAILASLLGILVYHERISHFQIAGIILGIASLVLILRA